MGVLLVLQAADRDYDVDSRIAENGAQSLRIIQCGNGLRLRAGKPHNVRPATLRVGQGRRVHLRLRRQHSFLLDSVQRQSEDRRRGEIRVGRWVDDLDLDVASVWITRAANDEA